MILTLRIVIYAIVPLWLLPLVGSSLSSAESYYLPPKANLPEVIFTFPSGEVTRKQLLAAILRAARQVSPSELPVFRKAPPPKFLDYILQDLLLKKNHITDVEKEAQRRLADFVREAGSDEKLDKNLQELSNPPLSRADFYRQIKRQIITERTNFNALTKQQLEAEFLPRWYGAGQAIAASAGGSDLTSEDLAQYLLLEADDAELKIVVQELINRRILLAETKKMGSNDEEISPPAALELVFAPFMQQDSLLEYYRRNKQEYLVYKLRKFVFSDRLQAGQNPAQKPAPAREQAQKLAAQLNAGNDVSTLLSTGRLLYATNAGGATPPPPAYGMDYSYDTGGQELNPFQPLPQDLQGMTTTLQAGKATKALPEGEDYVVYFCEEILPPRNIDQLLPLLKIRRLREQYQYLLKELTDPVRATWHWKPEERIPYETLYPAVAGKNAPQPTLTLPPTQEHEPLPELE